MNKEEDYRNLAGNITMFTDNTSFYEDWLVIQQYVDDWLDEIDKLQQENAQLKEENERYRKLGFKHLNERNEKLESVLKEIREYIEKECSDLLIGYFHNRFDTTEYYEKLLEIIDKAGIGEENG